MLIAVAGSQGTGKSTLLARLPAQYPVIHRKTSRSILQEWGLTLDEVNSNLDLVVKFQYEILSRKMEDDQVAAWDENCIWFTERTPIDLLTYASISIGPYNKYSSWLNDYGAACIAATNQLYDGIIYLQGGLFDITNDGTRGANRFYGELVDATMDNFYQRYAPKDRLHQCNTADMTDRMKLITNLVEHITRKDQQ